MDKIFYFMSIIMGVKICIMHIKNPGNPSAGCVGQGRKIPGDCRLLL